MTLDKQGCNQKLVSAAEGYNRDVVTLVHSTL